MEDETRELKNGIQVYLPCEFVSTLQASSSFLVKIETEQKLLFAFSKNSNIVWLLVEHASSAGVNTMGLR